MNQKCYIPERRMMIGLKVAFLVIVAMVVSAQAGDGPRCVDQQDNCAHFVEEKPSWCNAMLAEICPKSCGHCEGPCVDAGDWCMDRCAAAGRQLLPGGIWRKSYFYTKTCYFMQIIFLEKRRLVRVGCWLHEPLLQKG